MMNWLMVCIEIDLFFSSYNSLKILLAFSIGLDAVTSSQWPKMDKYNAQVDDDEVFMVNEYIINIIIFI